MTNNIVIICYILQYAFVQAASKWSQPGIQKLILGWRRPSLNDPRAPKLCKSLAQAYNFHGLLAYNVSTVLLLKITNNVSA